MNFWSAYTSGQPFRRKHWRQWYKANALDIRSNEGIEFKLSSENLNAIDYEILPREVEIWIQETAKLFADKQV